MAVALQWLVPRTAGHTVGPLSAQSVARLASRSERDVGAAGADTDAYSPRLADVAADSNPVAAARGGVYAAIGIGSGWVADACANALAARGEQPGLSEADAVVPAAAE